MNMKNNLTKYERDMKNNPTMRCHVAGLVDDFASSSIKLSEKPNRQYDLSDFSRGMMQPHPKPVWDTYRDLIVLRDWAEWIGTFQCPAIPGSTMYYTAWTIRMY